MKYEVYKDIKITDDYSIFDFVSVGRNGNIPKRIEFMPTEIPGFFNLAFGEVDENGEIDDYNISDNGDRNKVLATVAYAVEIYLNKYSDRWVYFRGSTLERARLYRMAIGLNLEELSLKFEIYAEHKNGVVEFQRNVEAIGLLVKRK
ncbi:MAG TPA: hypothetical protein VG890_16925 [Puia sp.]|nr:hypothetical protein [Puia sp.]